MQSLELVWVVVVVHFTSDGGCRPVQKLSSQRYSTLYTIIVVLTMFVMILKLREAMYRWEVVDEMERLDENLITA